MFFLSCTIADKNYSVNLEDLKNSHKKRHQLSAVSISLLILFSSNCIDLPFTPNMTTYFSVVSKCLYLFSYQLMTKIKIYSLLPFS